MTDARVSLVAAEALTDATPSARVALLAAEALTAGTPDARVSLVALEVLTPATSGNMVSLVAAEVLTASTPSARVALVALEVLTDIPTLGDDVPQAMLEIKLGGVWVDATAYWSRTGGTTITRGRQSEVSVTEPGTMSLVLKNDDGRWTPTLTTGAHYPNVVRNAPIRFLNYAGGQWRFRFNGYVDVWSVAPTLKGVKASTMLSCVDRQSLDSLRTLGSMAGEAITRHAPAAHWDLTKERTGNALPPVSSGGDPLVARYSGLTGGTLELGGDPTPAEPNAGTVFTPAIAEGGTAATGGYRLEASHTLGSSYSVAVCYGGTPTTDGPMLRVGKVHIDADGGRARWPGAAAELDYTLGRYVDVFSVNASGVVIASDTDRVVRTAPTSSALVQVGGRYVSGVGTWSGCTVSHVAILPYLDPTAGADMDELYDSLSMATAPISEVIEELLALSGAGSAAVTVLGTEPTTSRVQTAGRSAQASIDALALGTMGRYFIDREGHPTYTAYDYSPTTVTQPATAYPSGDLLFEPDLGAFVTDVTTTLPSGGEYTYSAATGLARPGLSLEGVMPTDSECRAVAIEFAERSSDDPRLRNLGFDLTTMDGADADRLLAMDVGSVVNMTDLQPQIPAQVVAVEGITESIDFRWTLSLNTSPAPDAGEWFVLGVNTLETGVQFRPF